MCAPACAPAATSRPASAPIRRAEDLHRRGLIQASIAALRRVRRDDPSFADVAPWIVRLSGELPDTAELEVMTWGFDEATCGRWPDLAYLCARRTYGYRADDPPSAPRRDEIVRLVARVPPTSRWYAPAQMLAFGAWVHGRKSVPAVQTLQRISAGRGPLGELARMDVARVYYSASVRIDERGDASVDAAKLDTAIAFWSGIPGSSPYAKRARLERGWAYFMKGDSRRVVADVEPLALVEEPDVELAEADILLAIDAFARCDYGAVNAALARYERRYEPLRAELSRLKDELVPLAPAARVERVQALLDGPPSPRRAAVARAFDVAPIRRRLAYERLLDEERRRVDAAPGVPEADRRDEAAAVAFERARLTKEIAYVFAANLATTLADLGWHQDDDERLRADVAGVRERPCKTSARSPRP